MLHLVHGGQNGSSPKPTVAAAVDDIISEPIDHAAQFKNASSAAHPEGTSATDTTTQPSTAVTVNIGVPLYQISHVASQSSRFSLNHRTGATYYCQ